MRPLRGLQETRVATREESGVLGFRSESQGRGSLVGCRLWGRTELSQNDQEEAHMCPLTHQPGMTDIKPRLPTLSCSARVCRFRNQGTDAPPSGFTIWPQGPL